MKYCLLIIGSLAFAACSGSTSAVSPAVEGARSFRPLSELFFLPEDVPSVTSVQEGANLVPDSKIEWDLRVTVQNLGLGGVEVAVRDQAVVLTGIVPSEDAKSALMRAANATRGVKSVTQSVEVVP